MPKRISALVAMTAMSTMLLFTGGTAIAAPPAPNVTIPDVTGTFPGGGTFDGTFDITQIAVRNGELVAVGTLTGTLTNAVGTVVGTVTNLAVNLPLGVT